MTGRSNTGTTWSSRVKVPFSMNLAVSTINKGNIAVRDVTGALKVHNVKEASPSPMPRALRRSAPSMGASPINYLSVPPEPSSYHTINGELNITYPAIFPPTSSSRA